MKRIIPLLLPLIFQFCFIGIENPLESKSTDNNPALLVLGLFMGGASAQASDQPTVFMPNGMDPVPITRADIGLQRILMEPLVP